MFSYPCARYSKIGVLKLDTLSVWRRVLECERDIGLEENSESARNVSMVLVKYYRTEVIESQEGSGYVRINIIRLYAIAPRRKGVNI